MPRYAILKDGQFVNTVLASEEWAPPEGHTKELFDPVVHIPPAPPEPTERWVSSFRFLFELHDVMQRVQLDAFTSAAKALTLSQIINMDPEAVDTNGIPITALRIIRLAYEQMERLNNRVDLLSHNMTVFFAAVSSLGIYGQTSEEITAEIARIQSDTPPIL